MTTKKPAAAPTDLKTEEIGASVPVVKRAGCRGIPGPGRPKGMRNKITREVAEMVKDALECSILEVKGVSPAKLLEKYDGGTAYLIQRSKQQPNAFMQLVSKLMPTKINAEVNVNNDLAARLTEIEQRIKNSKS